MSKKPPSEVIFKYEDGTPVALLDEVRCLDAEEKLQGFSDKKEAPRLTYTVIEIKHTHISCRLNGGSSDRGINAMHYGKNDMKLLIKLRGAKDAA